ncbi:helix-turn-helix transcriptional regulator [Hydrogenophaga sp. IBVHS1]|uniref:helix-turn-helix transcriptional regulator n=1 Tax=unclassified Hydrogenophaga TaxID=2610897 RepID=UPI000A2E399B|nr:helix-turn-helix transcriptional regulator [Hydrogenophaga sp. IBVHS1]OSZ71642.1 helix-turn-helix transcriptional regulator [Hydrogenophaga sp. IBVHS1]
MQSPSLGQAELSAILLRLYRLSHELPIAEFQDAALQLVREALPFDSSMWGTATNTAQGIDIHTIHLHNQPEEMLSAYEEVKHLDTAAQAAGQQPRSTLAFNARDWFHGRDQAPLLEYGKRFDQANFFISSDFDPSTQLVHWVTLFRANEAARGTHQERELLALLAPHVMQALTLNRVAHLDRMESPDVGGHGSAICDQRGAIYHADEPFESLLKAAWAGWKGPRLPRDLLESFLRGHSQHRGPVAVVSVRVEQGLLFVRARPRCAVDDLTPRERTVAELVVRGSTYKEIAQMLDRSPATVRNQIRSIYDKLQITNIVGLIDALRAVAQDPLKP